jgi:hypothetical protein
VDLDIKIELLTDIKTVFGASEKLSSKELCSKLASLEDRTWAEWKGLRSINPNQVARLLAEFDIAPGTIWLRGSSIKGYRFEQFTDAFARYTPKRNVRPSGLAQPKARQTVIPDGLTAQPGSKQHRHRVRLNGA